MAQWVSLITASLKNIANIPANCKVFSGRDSVVFNSTLTLFGIASYLTLVGKPEIGETDFGKPDFGKKTWTRHFSERKGIFSQ